MNKPTYIDPLAVEATMRELSQKIRVEALAQANSDEQRLYLDMQYELREVLAIFHGWFARQANAERAAPLIGEAFCATLAMLMVGLARNMADEPDDQYAVLLQILNRCEEISVGIFHSSIPGMVSGTDTVNATEGGNA